jgi:peroxiredoxin
MILKYCIFIGEPVSYKKMESTMKTRISLVLFLAFGAFLHAQEVSAPVVGAAAPDFTLPFATKDSISRMPIKLSDFEGKRVVVIAFYPADWSTGCTKEVCTMRDNFAALENLNAEIFAISGDYVWSHHEWAKYQNLPFKLLSDHSHAVAKLYGSFNEKSMYNKRTVFVVDKHGAIAYENMAYSVADLEDFNKLKDVLAALK